METMHWVILLCVAIALAFGIGAIYGIGWMVNDTDEWMREINAENEQLRERLETYRTDATKELEGS